MAYIFSPFTDFFLLHLHLKIMSVSKRASESLTLTSAMFTAFSETLGKMYHPELNPNGSLNLGVAHNDLLQQKVYEKVRKKIHCSGVLFLTLFFWSTRTGKIMPSFESPCK